MYNGYTNATHIFRPRGPLINRLSAFLSRGRAQTHARVMTLYYRNAVVAGGRSCVTTRTARYDDDGSVTSASRRFVKQKKIGATGIGRSYHLVLYEFFSIGTNEFTAIKYYYALTRSTPKTV